MNKTHLELVQPLDSWNKVKFVNVTSKRRLPTLKKKKINIKMHKVVMMTGNRPSVTSFLDTDTVRTENIVKKINKIQAGFRSTFSYCGTSIK